MCYPSASHSIHAADHADYTLGLVAVASEADSVADASEDPQNQICSTAALVEATADQKKSQERPELDQMSGPFSRRSGKTVHSGFGYCAQLVPGYSSPASARPRNDVALPWRPFSVGHLFCFLYIPLYIHLIRTQSQHL